MEGVFCFDFIFVNNYKWIVVKRELIILFIYIVILLGDFIF